MALNGAAYGVRTMHIYLRGDGLQRLRLASGLILFAFAATHFLNHALGLVGLEAMHTAQEWRTAVTRSLPGTLVLASALIVHIALGLYKLAKRKTWRMPGWEAVQIGFGIAIPFLLFPHIVNTRIAHTFFGVEDTYLYELKRLWPDNATLQSLLLLLVWTHGCIGLHYWLRLTPFYRSWAAPLRAAAIGVPLLALAGFAAAGGMTADIMSDPDALAALKLRSHWPTDTDGAILQSLRDVARLGFAALLLLIAGIHAMRVLSRLKKSAILVSYVGGPTITLRPGMSLLEGSRAAGIPHASVCGGRARCSTCRVKVESGLETLPPPEAAEAVTLQSIEAPANVRLACQLRPLSSLTITIVTPPGAPGPPGGDFMEMKSAVTAHVRALVSEQLVDFASSDQDVLGRYIGSKAGSPVAMSLVGDAGRELIGAREDVLLDRPAVAIVFKQNSKLITLFVLPDPDADAVAVRGQRNGYHVLSWSDGQFAYCAVSDLGTDELDKLEQSFSLVKALDVESRTQ